MKTLLQALRIPSLPPSDDPWGRALRRGAIAYILSRIVVVMGASIAVAAEAVTARVNEEEPKGGLSALVQVLIAGMDIGTSTSSETAIRTTSCPMCRTLLQMQERRFSRSIPDSCTT